jgi:hypothetical protein
VTAGLRQRLVEVEVAVARLASAPGASPVEVLARRDPSSLTEPECVQVAHYLARKHPPGSWSPPPMPLAEERELRRQWWELTACRG